MICVYVFLIIFYFCELILNKWFCVIYVFNVNFNWYENVKLGLFKIGKFIFLIVVVKFVWYIRGLDGFGYF